MIEGRHAAWWLVGAVGLAGCGGELFISADATGEGGAGADSGAAGKTGGKLTPGMTNGGSAAMIEPGTGGTTAMVGPGDVIDPSEGGSDDPGMVGGEAGAGMVDPGPRKLDLTECGADAFGTGIMPTLYSTLDSALAITSPAIGELGFVSNSEGDYHGGHCGSTSINIDQQGEYIKYHYQDNDVVHYSTVVGAMDFWYRPSYAHTDGLNHHLFSSANWATAGGFRLRKAAADNANAFEVIVSSGTLQVMELSVPADAYEFSPGQWTRITLVWYLAPNFGERYVRLFFDGTQVGEVIPETSFQMAPDLGGYFVFGVWDFNDAQHASGWLDDFKVFGRGP